VFANCCISVVFTCFVCIINTLLLSLSSLPMKITPYRWNKPYSIINESWIKVVKKFWNNGSSSELYPEFLSKLYQISLPKENVMKALTFQAFQALYTLRFSLFQAVLFSIFGWRTIMLLKLPHDVLVCKMCIKNMSF
jgi:hypothetical protein